MYVLGKASELTARNMNTSTFDQLSMEALAEPDASVAIGRCTNTTAQPMFNLSLEVDARKETTVR